MRGYQPSDPLLRAHESNAAAQGVTYQLTQGVTKNIIPAIPSTNAIVAAACTLEALKIITDVSCRLDNYMMCGPAPLHLCLGGAPIRNVILQIISVYSYTEHPKSNYQFPSA